jgi:Hint domain/Fibronectin type III domain
MRLEFTLKKYQYGISSQDYFGRSVAVSGDGLTVAIGAANPGSGNNQAGYVTVFRNFSGFWYQIGSRINGASSNQEYNISLSYDGNTLAVGGTGYSSNKGLVKVYSYSNVGKTWSQKGSTLHGNSEEDHFGCSVSLSSDGNILAVGANGIKNSYVNVYTFSSDWSQLGASINSLGRGSGNAVALSSDGTSLAIANSSYNSNTGAVGVFVYDGVNWNNGITKYGDSSGDLFGYSVSLSADASTLAVCSSADGGSYARVFDVNSGNQRGSDIRTSSYFTSVSLFTSVNLFEGTQLALGGYATSTPGFTMIYNYISSDWSLGTTLTGNNTGDRFGYFVGISQTGTLVVGAGYATVKGNTNNGYANIYQFNVPSKPTDVSAIAGNSQAIVSFTAPTYDGGSSITSYTVTSFPDGLLTATGSSSPIIVTGLTNETLYTFTVHATNANGDSSESDPSNQVKGVPCFLGCALVETPAGPKRIDSLKKGDAVVTADGRSVPIQRIHSQEVSPSTSNNPYVIEKGQFGATETFAISPRHRVFVSGEGMIEARDLGLKQKKMTESWTYYNIELPNWESDNLVVHGVEVESLAPVVRMKMSLGEFVGLLKNQYGAEGVPKEVAKKIVEQFKMDSAGEIEATVVKRR